MNLKNDENATIWYKIPFIQRNETDRIEAN